MYNSGIDNLNSSHTSAGDVLNFGIRKWKRTGHVAKDNDDRWTLKSVVWLGPKGTRARSHPRARWPDDVTAVTGERWLSFAKDKEKWYPLEERVRVSITQFPLHCSTSFSLTLHPHPSPYSPISPICHASPLSVIIFLIQYRISPPSVHFSFR
ncbi:hypothetical protein EVAR_42667_1 [Eumeta japonica]|uniref:Uncharacterized protein n=1 Tax=Eumeta variegata TaxID=151549 RepID=A0A4C1YKT8_EUMVA|nr:hypothetical protein EVAR_42667_1 [Eumeta japonica]